MKETIKIRFVDVWFKDYRESQVMSFIIDTLSECFELRVVESDPDCIICSCYGEEAVQMDACKVFFSGENVIPDFNLYDYGIGCSHLDFGDRYLRIPLYMCYQDDFQAALKKHLLTALPDKKKFCNMVVSNGTNADPIRTELFFELSKYKQVDSGGRYLNNVGGAVSDKIAFQRQYKFSFAMENTSMPGYVSEKITQAWAAGTIPIYWGDPEIEKEFNKDAFVNCGKKSLKEITEEIISIDQDDALYKKMLQTPICTGTDGLYSSRYLDQSVITDFFSQIVESNFQRHTLTTGAAGGYLKRRRQYSKLYYSAPASVLRKVKKLSKK